MTGSSLRRARSGAPYLFCCGTGLTLFGNPQCTCQANGRGEDSANEHPNGFVGRVAGKEPGNVRVEGVGGVDAHDNERNAPDKQGDKKEFILNEFKRFVDCISASAA